MQRAFKDDEQLISFSKAIVQSKDNDIDQSLPKILQFLELPTNDIKALKYVWLALWVNIMHQAGLGYTITAGRKTRLAATDLGRFVADTHNTRAYYYYWALRFQFPFGFPKHAHYIDNKVAVQPTVLMCEYLDNLNKTGDGLNDTFLSKYEIAHFLMKSTGHAPALIQANCERIIRNRKKKYNYEAERQNQGFEVTADHLFSRGRLFLEKFDLLMFRNDTVIIPDADTLAKVETFLSYRKPAFLFSENSQDARNKFFQHAYCNLDPPPEALISAGAAPSPESVEAVLKAMIPEATVNFPVHEIIAKVKRALEKVEKPRQPRVFDIEKELASISIGAPPDEIKRERGVLVQPNIKMHAETDLQLHAIEGEEVYLPPAVSEEQAKTHIAAIKEFRVLLGQILNVWSMNLSKIVHISIEPPPPYRDAHHERGAGIIFNVSDYSLNKSPIYWVWTTARELTYLKFGRLNDMTLPFMRDLVVMGLRSLHDRDGELN